MKPKQRQAGKPAKPSTKQQVPEGTKLEGDSDLRIMKNVNQPLGMMARTIRRIKAAKQYTERS